jgi:hypothetical protein
MVGGLVILIPGAHGALGEAEHVGAQGVVGAAAAFVGWQGAIGVYIVLETLEEGLPGRSGSGAAVGGAAPRDLGSNSSIDVGHWFGARLLRSSGVGSVM